MYVTVNGLTISFVQTDREKSKMYDVPCSRYREIGLVCNGGSYWLYDGPTAINVDVLRDYNTNHVTVNSGDVLERTLEDIKRATAIANVPLIVVRDRRLTYLSISSRNVEQSLVQMLRPMIIRTLDDGGRFVVPSADGSTLFQDWDEAVQIAARELCGMKDVLESASEHNVLRAKIVKLTKEQPVWPDGIDVRKKNNTILYGLPVVYSPAVITRGGEARFVSGWPEQYVRLVVSYNVDEQQFANHIQIADWSWNPDVLPFTRTSVVPKAFTQIPVRHNKDDVAKALLNTAASMLNVPYSILKESWKAFVDEYWDSWDVAEDV